MVLPLLAAAPSFLGALGGAGGVLGSLGSLTEGAGGAAPVSVPQSSAASAGPIDQTQNVSFGSAFAVGGGGATAGAPLPTSSIVALGGIPIGTLAIAAAAAVAAFLLLRRA